MRGRRRERREGGEAGGKRGRGGETEGKEWGVVHAHVHAVVAREANAVLREPVDVGARLREV